MVSREELKSGANIYREVFHSRKHLNIQDMSLTYGYAFEENTYDGKSEITAEMYLEGISQISGYYDDYYDYPDDHYLAIWVYYPSSVTNYVSFYRYSYLDWLVDL